MIEVIVVEDYWEMSRKAAQIIARHVWDDPESVIGLATGSTPIGMYDELIKMFKHGLIDFSKTVTFNLDEYWPMKKSSPYSYHYYMRQYFFNHVNIKPENIHIPDGEVKWEDIDEHCSWYEDEIKSHGGIDIQVLGIGGGYYDADGRYIGGHIGFNEPGSPFDSRTRLVKLSEQTRSDNSRFFMRIEEVPHYAITMGIATIMEAREIILLASGEHKANSIREAVEGPLTNMVPASILQKHRNVKFIIDKGAASRLTQTIMPWLHGNVNWSLEVRKAYNGFENLITRALTLTSMKMGKEIMKIDLNDLATLKLEELAKFDLNELKRRVLEDLKSKVMDYDKTPRGRRILIFSPHPDDDVICVGATMKILNDAGNDVRIAYMVSGNIAVRDDDIIEIANEISYNKEDLIENLKLGRIPIKTLMDLKAKVRMMEAINAAKTLGIDEGKIYFLRLPFYETGFIIKNPITEMDVNATIKVIEEVKPEIIIMPGEVDDPHGTHGKCIEIINKSLEKLNLRNEIDMWLYKGGWEEYMIYEANIIVPFNRELMNLKIEAIKKHKSQLTPLFQGLDPRPFWKRALDRNKFNGDILRRIGLIDAEYAELLKRQKL
ncbi:MAG: glucosamine-6-phosphate deaminase [archaeon YNP-LCB-003-016]|uniref:glucosamine-6-phosphate deaminase n=1 Tax=Candidatus Culexarchaeum yellowstonense TaxID=2928963 RepID=UPI0026F37A17|nr:glucosamine-6-phosphate deaminase [Candidatus Culexarchaeum yellowstonense]MCR6691692.1 glucosamine-6-phosphate deaminase [Candidatus Culexarchaeum yellowstonense]